MSLPIVGAHFRPPAKGILQALPLGHTMNLKAEPENPYDPNAIAVWVSSDSLADLPQANRSTMATLCMGYGYDWETLMGEPAWHFGYVPRNFTSLVHPRLVDGKLDLPLTSSSTGAPALEFT